MSTAALHGKALDIVRLSTRMTALAGSGHPSSAASIAHLVAHLLHREMRYDPADPANPVGDRLVLSQGHAVPAVYAAYAGLGGAVARAPGDRGPLVPLTVAELDRLRAIDSVLDGHPNPAEGFPFFDSATGSLGMGLSVAAGLAIAARLDGTPRRVFAIIGDGESREGQIWEAADFIVDHRLSHVCAIFNCNGQGQAGNVSGQQSASRLAAKLEAFGWKVESIDGHDPAQVASALSMVGKSERPLAIVARTVKGWGLEMLQKGNWHGKPPAAADLPAIEASIAAERKRLGAGGDLGGPPAPARGSAG